ncbi:hypothetical protein VTI74DRAFT_11424 [Chaetomium olivicolor]
MSANPDQCQAIKVWLLHVQTETGQMRRIEAVLSTLLVGKATLPRLSSRRTAWAMARNMLVGYCLLPKLAWA